MTTTTTVTRTRAFFPSLRGLIDSARVQEDDWSLLDEILCETFGQEDEPPPIPAEFPSLTSLGIGSGSNRVRSTVGPLAAELETETVREGIKYFLYLDSLVEAEKGESQDLGFVDEDDDGDKKDDEMEEEQEPEANEMKHSDSDSPTSENVDASSNDSGIVIDKPSYHEILEVHESFEETMVAKEKGNPDDQEKRMIDMTTQRRWETELEAKESTPLDSKTIGKNPVDDETGEKTTKTNRKEKIAKRKRRKTSKSHKKRTDAGDKIEGQLEDAERGFEERQSLKTAAEEEVATLIDQAGPKLTTIDDEHYTSSFCCLCSWLE